MTQYTRTVQSISRQITQITVYQGKVGHIRMLGENASPLKSTSGLRCCRDLTAVLNLSAPPTGSVSERDRLNWFGCEKDRNSLSSSIRELNI